jgi:transcriptional regulator with XRE-family HTH domain
LPARRPAASRRSAPGLDKLIGDRIRARRTELGLTQEQLAQALGLSYQQIQKFERGASRIGAVQLHTLAQRLGLALTDLLPTAGEPGPSLMAAEEGSRQRTALELARAFARIEDEEVRAALTALTRTLAERGSS